MSNQAIIWDFFIEKGLTKHGIAGMMGNIEAESGFLPNNLQNTYNTKFGMTDEAYTTEVDNGTYKNFATDSGGYGICQWTWSTRKQALKDKAKERGTSVGDIYTQMELLWDELNGSYTKTLAVLKTATTVKEASDMFLIDFERPADQSESAKEKRVAMGQAIYDEFATGSAEVAENKEKEEMSYNTFKEMMAKYEQEQGALPESPWAVTCKTTEKAVKLGITADAARPRAFATREEVEQMIISYDEKKGSA